MNDAMTSSQDTRTLMESAGFVLYRDNEPGIYVRRPAEKDAIDWQALSAELRDEVRKCMEAPVPQRDEVCSSMRGRTPAA